MNNKKELLFKKKLNIFLKIFLTTFIILILVLLVKELITNANAITRITQSAGILGPVVLILLISLGILFTPIPSILLIITAGYLYGVWEGALYSYIGHLLAAIGTYTAVNIFKIKSKNKRYKKYKKLVEKNKKILYLLYMIPVVPISVTSILSASFQIKFKHFLKIIFISFIPPVLFFSFFGHRINNLNLIEIGILIAISLIALFIAFEVLKKKINFSKYFKFLLKNKKEDYRNN